MRLMRDYGTSFQVVCSATEFNEPDQYEVDGIPVNRIVSPWMRSLGRFRSVGLARRLTNYLVFRSEMAKTDQWLSDKNFDLVHVFGFSPVTLATIRWAKKRGIPVMRELVNRVDSPFQYPPGHKLDPAFEPRSGSVYTAISEQLGDVCKAHGLIENVWVRPNPVNLSGFEYADQATRSTNRKELTTFSDDDTVLVFVSKFRKSKNHEFLIDVIERLPDRFKLLLAGPLSSELDSVPGFSEESIRSFTHNIKERGLADRISVQPGFVDAAKYMSAGDIFCMPPENEAMGTPLLEALATGLPSVANAEESSFHEWVVENENGYLRRLSADEWAAAVIEAEQFSETRRKTIATDIARKVSSEIIDRDYMALFRAMIASEPGEIVDVEKVLSR